MLRRQAFQFELMPNGQETRQLRQFAGSCRFVYNKALAINTQRYEKKEKRFGYAELCALLPSWKKEHPFLSDAPAQALQQSLKNLERAYTNFFEKRADFPKFKKIRSAGEFPYPARLCARQPERASRSPEDGLDALPQVARRTGRSQKPHPK